MTEGGDLFQRAADGNVYQPLAALLRPTRLDAFFGQAHLLAPGKPLAQAIARGQLHSMLLWGPPGVGKTSLARIAADAADAVFLQLSAVLAGVRDIRAAVETAQQNRHRGRNTVLFVDEVHRFNKSQQDAFLPYVEDGTLIFIGATTENPAFEVNSALLSRARVYKLRALQVSEMVELLAHAVDHIGDGLRADPAVLSMIAELADGDARRALNLLELAADLVEQDDRGVRDLVRTAVEEVSQQSLRRFDKGGDQFYDLISALHKSVRGSAPDASLYWLCRMLDGGCDPLYLARRIVRIASEDIGNADPRALTLCLDAWQVVERLGSPEGELALAQAVLYLACAPKSNAVYRAFKSASADVAAGGTAEVPLHLRNAPTTLAKQMDHGTGYRYAHDEEDAYAAGERYLPPELGEPEYYQPVSRGLEQRIQEKLAALRERDARSAIRREPG
ncbi:MAG: replication-associated recombination protein A [Chromatocurvus sp.]